MLKENLDKIKKNIQFTLSQSSRSIDGVRLIGASKKQPTEKIIELAQAGLLDFGENFVQEWQQKYAKIKTIDPIIANKIRWHLIGHLQSNKIKDVAGQVEYIHSIDSLLLAQRLSAYCAREGIIQKVLLQVNIGAEHSKYGFSPVKLLQEIKTLAALPGLNWQGLMCIPPGPPRNIWHGKPFESEEEFKLQTRRYFAGLKSLLTECNTSGYFNTELTELSMGMSQDYTMAIEEGATMVRIGTSLLGPRK